MDPNSNLSFPGSTRTALRPLPRVQPVRPPECTLRMKSLEIERKKITISLRENPRGRFLKIVEEVGGKRDAVIIPTTGLKDFMSALEEIARTANSLAEPQRRGGAEG